MFSTDKLYASVSQFGIGTFANKNLRPEEDIMSIPANYTISCFDNYFPHMDLANKVAEQWKDEAGINTINEFRLILNFNYLRYVDRSNRFFRIYFDNLPNYMEYFPFWAEEEKSIIKKLMADPTMGSDLAHNDTNLDYMLEDFKRVLKRKDPNMVPMILSDKKIYEAINLINSRGYTFSYKGWKVINNKLNEIESEDIYNVGVIIIPGADGINHESTIYEQPNVRHSNFQFREGEIAVKAGRKFKKGEEFKINYQAAAGTYEIFKKYGFVPLDSINHNQIYRRDVINLTNSTFEVKQLCMALGACQGRSPHQDMFRVPVYTNSINEAELNLERLNYWLGPPINQYKVIEVFNMIKNDKHSNITEGIALSKLMHKFYGSLIYSVNFRTTTDILLSMYDLNEKHVDIREIFKMTNIKVAIKEHPNTIHQRFRELLKFAFLNQHMVAVNVIEAEQKMERTLDNLWVEARKEILENLIY
jgi:hypothetical protein